MNRSTRVRKKALLDAIQYHIQQTEASLRELRGLLADDNNQSQPLARLGNGEYAVEIEAKYPRRQS